MAGEKRRYERYDNQLLTIEVARTGFKGFVLSNPSAECMNFSRTGMQFDCPKQLDDGEKVLIDISIDDISLHDLKAEVISRQQTDNGDWCHGVRFCLEDIGKDQVFHKLLLIEDKLYVIKDDGVATCVDAKSGKTVWKRRIGGNYSASPIFADGRIYFLSEEGRTTVVAPQQQFRHLAVNSLKGRFLASPAVGNRALFIRSETHLYRIE